MHTSPHGFLRRNGGLIAGALAALIVLPFIVWQRCGMAGCPNVQHLTSWQPRGATILLDAAGEQFADLAPIHYTVVPLDSLPDHLTAAFRAVEHERLALRLAGDAWPELDRSRLRRLFEMRVARDIEAEFTEEQILELYLNHLYFGGGAYGIEAASRNYFDKPAAQLTLAEAAQLAALPQSPTRYNPRRYTDRARTRRNEVLSLMVAQGTADSADAALASATRLDVRSEPPVRRTEATVAPYFVEVVRRVLEDRLGERAYTLPLRVHTTLVRAAQHTAEQQLERQLRAIEQGSFGDYDGDRYSPDSVPRRAAGRTRERPSYNATYVQGAFLLMDAATGDIQALVGGRNFRDSRYDRSTQLRRQAGSAFQPFVFAAAIEAGYPPSQFVSDSVLRVQLSEGEVWEAHNMDSTFDGAVTIRDALVRSKNVPTVRLAADVGLPGVTGLARRAGIRSELPNDPSVATGTSVVTPLELTASYSSFARLGTAVSPRFITRVEHADGSALWETPVNTRTVMDSATAFLVTDMLEEAVERGTASAVRRTGFRGPAAGMDGTTEDGADAWFVGYTTSHVATVWIGFDRPRPIVEEPDAAPLAVPVWARVMREHARTGTWTKPSTIVEHTVDPASGLALIDGCLPDGGAARTELFVEGAEPVATCPAGEPAQVEAGALARVGSWIAERRERFARWVTRHFGTEERQPVPRGPDYLGVPRLPIAEEPGAD